MKYIDTHAHYYINKFKDTLEELVKYEFENELEYIINLGTDVSSNKRVLELIQNFEIFYGMIGFFPTSVHEIDESLSKYGLKNREDFEKQLHAKKIIGIGEIGLDYNWDCVGSDKTPKIIGSAARDIQKQWFRYQLELARSLDLPVSMHSRDAEQDTLSLFKEFESIKGVMHCFSYGIESAKEYLDKGLYLGIGGTSTYKNNVKLREVIKYVPLDRLLLETDAPYLSPQEVRREVNISTNIPYVIDNIARIKSVSPLVVIEQTNKNAYELFKFKKV